jgi:hypothetical protein
MEDTTPYQIEPTLKVASPYDFIPIPPPPPKRVHRPSGLIWVLASLTVLSLLVSSVFLYLGYSYAQSVKPPPKPTVKTVIQAQPTTSPSYTAQDIMSHIIQTGVKIAPCTYYNQTVYLWSEQMLSTDVQASSSVAWSESDCTIGSGWYGLFIYPTPQITNDVFIELQKEEANISPNIHHDLLKISSNSPIYEHGNCLLMNVMPNTVYVEVINKYCL